MGTASVTDPETGETVKKTLSGLVARRSAEAAPLQGPGQKPGDGLCPMPQAVVAPTGSDANRIRPIQAIVGGKADGRCGPVTKAPVVAWPPAGPPDGAGYRRAGDG